MADRSYRDLVHLGFCTAAGLTEHRPQLLGFHGREKISRLFEFELLVAFETVALTENELTLLLSEPAVFAVGPSEHELVHGMVSRADFLDLVTEGLSVYRLTFVPQVALLGFGRHCAIYEGVTVPNMVQSILESYGLQSGDDFTIHCSQPAKSPSHEYIVQYEESDWAFIERWLEHEGFFYYFEHGKKRAKLVIGDANDAATPIARGPLGHGPRTHIGDDERISSFAIDTRRVARRATLVDYNAMRPGDILCATEDVDPSGFGHVFDYRDHYRTSDVGSALAIVRAQELDVDRRVARGISDSTLLRAGHVLTLENHRVAGYDGKYLITSVDHAAGASESALATNRSFEAATETRHYEAQFTAIPAAVPYRPRRTTPWPSVNGVINAHVEADTSGEFAQIDDQGRYKVKFTFDTGKRQGLASSRWIRMAEAYAGAGYGIHYPLHKGTEVLVAHVNGDPDRPLIVGAVPNTLTPSPVTSANAAQSVLQSASGIRVEIDDARS